LLKDRQRGDKMTIKEENFGRRKLKNIFLWKSKRWE